MKKIIIIAIAVLLSMPTFAKGTEASKNKVALTCMGLGMFTTGLILHQREMNSSHKFEGPGIGIGPNQLLQVVGLSAFTLGIVIKF
jgi:hypothetical protein